MQGMFYGCKGLTKLDVSNFNTSHVTNMNRMFSNCDKLIELDISGFDTSNVTSMTSMFSRSKQLVILDLSSFNNKRVTNMNDMFFSCENLQKIYVSEYDDEKETGWISKETNNGINMFLNAKKIMGGNGTTYNGSHIDVAYARIDTAETPGYLTNIKDKR